jgi:hypothetical protein
LPEDKDVVETVPVAVPELKVNVEPVAVPSTSNCAVPVGVVVTPDVPDATVTVIETELPAVTLVGEAVTVVVEIAEPPDESGVTAVQLLTKLATSSEPHPVARSYPVVAL